MAGSAVIGALRVDLELSTGSFSDGAKRAGAEIDKFSKNFGVAGAAITRVAGVIGTALAGMFTVQAIHSALEYADSIYKAAQAAGITTKEFSALVGVAALAGVEMEEFATTLTRFNKNIIEAQKGANDQAVAFKTLGIATRDLATGDVRSMADILGDVAEKFSGYANNANKAAIAQELFGKAGARLIPFLNQGRAGIEELKAEMAKLGVVVSDDVGKKAEEFNDAMRKMSLAMKGLALEIGDAMAGPGKKFADFVTFILEHVREGMVNTKDLLGDAMELRDLNSQWELAAKKVTAIAAAKERLLRNPNPDQETLGRLKADLDAASKKVDALATEIKEKIWNTKLVEADKESAGDLEAQRLKDAQELRDAHEQAAETLRIATERTALYGEVMQGLASPYDEMIAKQLELNRAQAAGAISTTKLAQAAEQAFAKMANSYAQVGVNVTSALAAIFNKSKGFAIAHALMQTYQSFTAALANPPGPPFSYINAAAALAAGYAQVRNIQQTNPGSGGAAPAPAASAPPSDAGGASAGGSVGAQSTLFVEGINPSGLFSGSMVSELAERLLQYQRDGGRVVLVPV